MEEDPVRALRAARFLAELPGFKLHPEARGEARAAAARIGRASAERIRDELNRILTAPASSRGIAELDRLGLLRAVLPELVPLKSCAAGLGRPDVWRHTLDALTRSERSQRLPGAKDLEPPEARLALRWALLLHDIAKPETLAAGSDGGPTFHGHEVLGARKADALLRRLRQPRRLRRRVTRLVLFHLRPHHLADASAPPRGMRRLVRDGGEDLPLLLVHAACDARASGAPDAPALWRRLRRVLAELHSLHQRAGIEAPPPLIDGKDVMAALRIAPGPDVGRILTEVGELQADGRLRDRADALTYLARHPARSRGSAERS
jgi:poly(A) polymerase